MSNAVKTKQSNSFCLDIKDSFRILIDDIFLMDIF